MDHAREDMLSFSEAKKIASRQQCNGSWGNGIYAVAARKTTGTERLHESTLYQLGRLVEYGFDSGNKTVESCADKVLIPLLNPENNTLWELSYYPERHPDLLPFLRTLLRDIALRLLCPAGYNNHTQVKEAIIRGLTELAAFLNRAKRQPIYRQAGGKTVMVGGVYFPTHHFLRAVAHAGWVHEIPEFRGLLGMYVDFIGENSPLPDYYLLSKKGALRHGHEAAFRSKEFYLQSPSILMQELEILARLGMVERTEQGQWLLDELLAHQDGDGCFRIPEYRKSRSFDYCMLEPYVHGRDIEPFTIDMTFRGALILHYLNYLV